MCPEDIWLMHGLSMHGCLIDAVSCVPSYLSPALVLNDERKVQAAA